MRRSAYSVATPIGDLELTKGAFLTLKRRKAQHPAPTPKMKHIRKAPTPTRNPPSPLKANLTVTTRSKHKRSSLKTAASSLQCLQEMQIGMEMEEESTWSNIDMAVYSLSLSLSAANFDHRWKVCTTSKLHSLITNRMKKYSQLESSSRLGQIESRLALHPFLSRGNLPSSCDAEVFLFMEEQRKIPSKNSHPNTYHWFILMKQFNKRTLQIWQQERPHDTTDRLAAEFIEQGTQMLKENRPTPHNRLQLPDKNTREPTTPRLATTPKTTSKKSIIFPCADSTDNNNLPNDPPRQTLTLKLPLPELPSRSDLPSPLLEVEYVMELQLKDDKKTTKMQLHSRLMEEKVEMLQVDNDEEGPIMRITIKTEKEEWDRLKDRISKWQEISNLQFRKEKKGGQGFRTEAKSERTLISPREAH